MAFTFIVKNTSTVGKEPTAAQIQRGELALNLADHKLYSKGVGDEIFEIGAAGETPNGGTDERPSGPSLGDLYFDTDLEALLYWNGTEWVPVGTESISLNDLSDVDTTGVANGMVIAYDQATGEWKPVDPAFLAVDVDLDYTPNGNSDGTVNNSAGDDATIPIAIQADSNAIPNPTVGVAGLFTGLEKEKLAGIEPGAQVNDGYTKDESDERYLRVDADAPDQVRLAGDVEFKGLIKTAGGIYASGFSNDNFLATNANIFIANPDDPNGSNATYQFFNTSGWFKATTYNATYGDYLYTTSARGNGVFEVVRATNPDSGGSTGNGSTIVTDFRLNITGGGIASHQTNHRIGAVKGVVSQRDDFRNTQACGDRRHYAFVGSASPESDQIAADADKQGKAGGYVFFQTDNKTGIKDLVAFDVDHQGIDGQDFVAFKSKVETQTGSNNFNLNFSGDAPNFLAGSTYIGGDISRNTFELWKSTLTQEQLQQFEAGTFAAPASVTDPGDGEYARQWWYNQQDAETQALLDSGELEYPEHLAAATFTDTFVLGDNTNIELNANGRIKCKGVDSSKKILAPRYIAEGVTTTNSHAAFESNTEFAITGGTNSSTVYPNSFKSFVTNSSIQLDDFSHFHAYLLTNEAGCKVTQQRVFDCNSTLTDTADETYAFAARLDVGDGSKTNYNFYAQGTAPNFFKGLTEHEGGVQVSGGSSKVTSGLVGYPATTYPLMVKTNSDVSIRFTDKTGGTVYGQNLLARANVVDSSVSSVNGYFSNFNNINLTNVDQARGFITTFTSNLDVTGNCDNFIGYLAGTSDDPPGFATDAYGFRSELNIADAPTGECFGFYSAGDAPSFLTGTTYIGGNTTNPGTSTKINLNNDGSAEFSGAVTATSTGTQFISNMLGDDTASRNNNFSFQHEGTTSVQLRASRASGADHTSTNLQIRVGGAANYNRIVQFSPNLIASFFGDITAAGTITGSNITLRMQPDDPDAYQTTYTTDEDGEQVAEQTYIGATEDLLDIIIDLRARLAALEGTDGPSSGGSN